MELRGRPRRLWRYEPGVAAGRRENPRLAHCRPADLDTDRAKARAAEFSLKDAPHRQRRECADRREPSRTSSSTLSCLRPGMRSFRRGLQQAAMCSARSRWPSRSRTRAISSRGRRPRGASTPSCKIAATLLACAASRGRCARARSARSPAFTPISSLRPHFGGFREEMDHVLLLDMAIHSFDALRCMTGLAASGVYCREWNPPQLLVSARLFGCGDL